MSESEHEGEDVVLAATDRALPVLVQRIEDERVPEGMIGLGTYLSNRLVARCAVTPDVADFIERKRLFDEPVPLVLAGREEPPGLQCRLFAVIRVEPDELEETEEAEPWAASAPRYEDLVAEQEEPEEEEKPSEGMVFLGQIV